MTKLTVTAQGERDLLVIRRFDAPRDKVWRALTEPDLLRRWMTSEYGALKSLEGEVSIGGQQHYVWEGEPEDLQVTITYDELQAPELIRHREHWPQHGSMESTVVTRLIEAGEATEMHMTITFPSAEAREEAIAFGMSDGMEAMYANLDTLLAG